MTTLQNSQPCVTTNNRFSVLGNIEEDEREQPSTPEIACNPTNKKKLLVLGSSHARHMGPALQDVIGDDFQVECICKPNAMLKDVVSGIKGLTKGYSKDDQVVIIGGGGNSIDRDPSYSIEADLDSISENSKHTNVNFVELFHRYDKPSLRSMVKAVNDKLWNFSGKHVNFNIVSVNSLRREEFTRHGLHLNSRGKKTLAELVAEELRLNLSNCNRPIPVIVGDSSRFLGGI